MKSLTAHERNKLFGGALSQFDIKDAKGFLAALGTNKETIKANLMRLRDSAAKINSTDKTLYPGLGKLDADQAPKTQGKIVRQNGHRYQQQPDGSYKAID